MLIVDVPAVENDRVIHELIHFHQVRDPEFFPLCNQQEAVCTVQDIVYALQSILCCRPAVFCLGHGNRIIGR